jgi:uncharacterized membrane protein YdjX (TVP38/TMEM64 family)
MTQSPSRETTDAYQSKDQNTLSLWRVLPVVVLLIGLITAFYMDLHHFLTFESLQDNRTSIMNWKQENYTVSTFAYVLAYGLATAISIPGAIWMTIAGGFMFGTIKGGLLVLFGATLGATIVFLAARYAFADFFHAKCGATIQKMEAGFKENAFCYLLVLRFVPLFPFWLVNLVPAFLSVPIRTFVISTFIGIMPGTFVYASLGSGLGHIIDQGGMSDIAAIWSPEILFPLIGLAFLALIPVIYRKYKKT